MTPEILDKIVKVGGVIVLVGAALACIRLLPQNPAELATIMGMIGAAYGVLGFNTPLASVRKAQGLVSVRAPSEHDVNQMRDAIKVADSIAPADPS